MNGQRRPCCVPMPMSFVVGASLSGARAKQGFYIVVRGLWSLCNAQRIHLPVLAVQPAQGHAVVQLSHRRTSTSWTMKVF